MVVSQEQKECICVWACQSKLLSEYLDFLLKHRGISENTLRFRRNDVGPFLRSLRIQNDSEDIGKISVKEIHDYVIKTAKHMNRPSQKHLVTSLRSFLKFCHFKGYIHRDLTDAVPVIVTPKLGRVPRSIPWESVEKLLAGTNRKTHRGRRTYAVLQLLATYGVRIGQVVKLQLQDINWRKGLIHIQPSKGGNPLTFPLYPKVADALLAYIRETRGKATYPEVFLTIDNLMPLRAVALSVLMQRFFRSAGIVASAHAIRHAFATRLMEQEIPIKTIADLLGHKSINTTFIYTKVDLKHLRLVACEWPEVLS